MAAIWWHEYHNGTQASVHRRLSCGASCDHAAAQGTDRRAKGDSHADRHCDSLPEKGRMGPSACHCAAGREQARLLGARHRAYRRGRSRQCAVLVSPRRPALSQGSRCRQRSCGARRRAEKGTVHAAAILPAKGIVPELAITAIPDDERIWVPQAPDVWFRPLLLNTVNGGWCNLLRVRRSGILSRHRHPMLVVGYVIKGRWRYLEHDWVAEEGSFVYEPPGETHTLVVPADCAEMITFFNISGAMIYLDESGRQTGYEDVFSKIEMCRAHYAAAGLGAAFVDQFVR